MYVCNGYHDVMISLETNSIVILNIKSVDCRCIIVRISKSETINALQNVGLSENRGSLLNIKKSS